MKQGQNVTQKELISNGWQQVDLYGDCEIWSKGDERILWNPTTKIIVTVYQRGI
jgi:hypothetical protein